MKILAGRIGRRALALATLLVLSALQGCGDGLSPVRGTVTLDDGTPISKGLVVFERFEGGPALTARGEIRPDGTYQLSTNKPGDGVPPGKYRVLINSMDLSDVPDEQKDLPYDVKYLNFKTSGLECEVKSGGTDYPIKLTRSAKKGRR
jgi:hypothetical protein